MAQLQMHRPHLHDLPRTLTVPDGYFVREVATTDDLTSLAETLSKAFGEVWGVDDVRGRLIDAADVHAVYVITCGERVVATASSRHVPEYQPSTGYVHWVGTHPDHVRKGLAAALIERVLQDFRSREYTSAVLQTDDFRLPAIKVYLRYGFLPVYEVDAEDHRGRWSALLQAMFARPTSPPR